MKNRIYNILFHTHTISGIIISAALYVIFFAGSFSFFRDDIVNWERNDAPPVSDHIFLDYDKTLDSLNSAHNLNGRDVEFTKYYIENRVSVNLSPTKDTLAEDDLKTNKFFYIDADNLKEHTYADSYSLGEFLYRLHFFAQIKYPFGYYLSGFVAFFFLFAIVTGVLVHWKKIVSNFYTFRPLAKLKTMWTDAHTGLGMIGLPFQFVYAVTGAFFMLKALLIAPMVLTLYNGDDAKFYDDLGYSHPHFEYANKPLSTSYSINSYIEKTKAEWENFNVTQIHIFNYNDENMHLLIEGHLDYQDKFNATGEALYNIKNKTLIESKSPFETKTYLDGVKNVMYRIHYGDYGGYILRLISFILGIISCFVIISGVMIWLVARNKKNIPEKKRKFNEILVRIYLAICLSMYPITAASFIAVKVAKPASMSFIYNFYFIGWLILTLLFILKKDNYFTNKICLLSGSIIGLLIPFANGFITGNWFWKTYSNGDVQLFFIDVFWIVLSLITLWVSLKIKRKTV
ncbi:membrane protein [Tamlana nanhaiensis]|uniref:Membrane protein n=1 Tax=Neotamlana nanhaiensis TaxID=1382798 RepID=A0A0D7VZK5_9FLAO|nr:PepSY-associated TM helix domain-containing protein [Tamlana nanhaiensis]KJD32099.1 membrane protein [Tamlana nanhaiensis]KJD32261.1 membrane protein [Tamlana nanhaiensis]